MGWLWGTKARSTSPLLGSHGNLPASLQNEGYGSFASARRLQRVRGSSSSTKAPCFARRFSGLPTSLTPTQGLPEEPTDSGLRSWAPGGCQVGGGEAGSGADGPGAASGSSACSLGALG